MPSNNPMPSESRASCRVTAGAAPTYTANRGFSAAPVRLGVGSYQLTLNQAQPVDKCSISLGRDATTHGSIAYRIVSQTVIQIVTFDAGGAAADANFSCVVERIPD